MSGRIGTVMAGVATPGSAADEHSSGAGPAPAKWQTYLELAALPPAVRRARRHVRAVAREWGLADLSDTAELLASELVTNAVQAASDPIRVWLTCDGASITICVWDSSPRRPVLRDAPDDAEGGRGLLLVSILGADWGISEEESGKTVWVWISR